jgi:hypothetical protein
MSQENVEIVQPSRRGMPMIWTPFWPSSIPTSSGTLRLSLALRERQLPTEVMTARERFGGRTAARRVNASPIGPRSSATSASPSSPLGHIDLTARVTGIEFRQEVGEVFDLRAGKIVRIRDFLTHAEAIEAAGLSEQDAHADS